MSATAELLPRYRRKLYFPSSISNEPPLVSRNSFTNVTRSLRFFSDRINNSGEIGKLADFHGKPGTHPSGLHFAAIVPEPYNTYLSDETSDPWHLLKGKYGFLLGVKTADEENPLLIGSVSFTPIENGILIEQIQGLRHPSPQDTARQAEIFSSFRVEYMLVNLVALWSQGVGETNLFIEPANNHAYYHTNEVNRQRAIMRYDVTARTLGFRRENKKALHQLVL